MTRRRFTCLLLPLSCLLQLVLLARADDAAREVSPIDFRQDVMPIFEQHCIACHGPEVQESSLRVDLATSLLRGGDWGERAIVPHAPEQSFLLKVVSGQVDDLKMPPPGKGEPLSEQELTLLKRWVAAGAAMPPPEAENGTDALATHWSFQPLGHPVPPVVQGVQGTPIDAFIQHQLQSAGLSPAPRADRRTLVRRLYMVMLGLPPTPEEVAAFVANEDPQAWEQLVDQVLNSPHYGERWGRHWLDLIRFGETNGFETNRERPHAWRYRDWVIAALNDDKPYDEFIRQQLAGDALGEPIATGFLVAGPHDIVKSPDINLTLMQRQDELTDLVNTTGTAFLGLTLGCARCHNHKFDPVTQRDFYALQAVFAGVEHGDRPLPLPVEQQRQLEQVDAHIVRLTQQLSRFLPVAVPGENLRPAVNAKWNIERFPATRVKQVRFTILATNSGEPCLDELAIFSGETQVGLKSQGAMARCSSALPGYEIHKLEHIHDGQFGNSHSWISNEPGTGWIEIELPEISSIDRIEWGRDREARFGDRLATNYRIETTLEAGEWVTIASSQDRLPLGVDKPLMPEYVFNGHPEELAAQGRRWLTELQRQQQQREQLAAPPMAYSGTFQQPGATHRLYRGDPMAPREAVAPDTVAVFGQLQLAAETPEQQRRLALANWIVQQENPLTARVIVNRLWQFQFGTGIVDTPSDFGRNGTAPTHPELLDWLAQELMANGWSLKHMHRQILLSHTWQQANTPHEQGLRTDGATRLLWRYPPRRLEAEAIRDSMLAVTGVLDLEPGGPGYSGFEVELENVRHYHPKSSFGPADWRRMVYMTKVRMEQDAVFGLFDCPDGSQVAPVRSRSTTPLQALNLLNSPFVLQQADLFAERLQRDAGSETSAQICRAYELCFGRQPDAEELAFAEQFVHSTSLTQFTRAMLNANEFLFVP